jgi:hypothetical protein
MSKPMKLSFHIPADEHHISELIQLVCDVTGTTPSRWVYGTVLKRLKETGLIDEKGQTVRSEYQTLFEALPPGVERKGSNVKHRSKKDS